MNKAEEAKLADLRNKMGPVYNYVALMQSHANPVMEGVKSIIAANMVENEQIVIDSMLKVKKILDSFE